MTEPKSPEKPVTSGTPPESPTTARELDFDDEPHDSANTSNDPDAQPGATTSSGAPKPGCGEDAAPPRPPRPFSPQQQAESTLKEAFPSIDGAVIKAVLTASSGKVEPAFNALLSMSDPDSQKEAPPPAQPPRPTASPLTSGTSTSQNQLEADEMYARQLAEHYSGSSRHAGARGGSRGRQDPALPRPQRDTGLKPNELYEDDHSFFDDDLPVIKENLRKGFLDTQSKVTKWVSDFKKKIEGEDEDETQPGQPSQGYHAGPPQNPYGSRRSGEYSRRSGDRERYDADPRVLSDDFTQLELRDEEAPPPRPTRPQANPNLFKPTPSPSPNGSRKVSFQDGPPEDMAAARKSSPRPQASPSGGGRQSKWQPLSSVDPVPAADNDPFSLGDSDDDHEAKSKDIKSEDTERLKKAAAEAMSDEIGPGRRKSSLEENAKTGPQGTKDEEAEKKLTGKS